MFLDDGECRQKPWRLPPADGSDGHGLASFGAQGQESVGGISRVEDLDYGEDSSLGEQSGCSPLYGTKTAADSIASTSSGAKIEDIRRREAVCHVLNEINPFDPESVYSLATVAAVLLGEGGDRVTCCLRVCFSVA